MVYKDFVDKHKGESIVVCGLSKSVTQINPTDFITIGVNDIGRLFCPNYLLVLNNQHGFKDGRWDYINSSPAPAIFTHLQNLPIRHPENIVLLSLGSYGKINLDDKSKVDYTSNSPYVGVIIAYQMGAKKIGLIGVDFTEDHFFAKTGKHALASTVAKIDLQYDRLNKNLKQRGIEFYNLSKDSLIKSVPYKSIEDFKNGK